MEGRDYLSKLEEEATTEVIMSGTHPEVYIESKLKSRMPLSIILLIQEYVSTDIISTFLSQNVSKIDMDFFRGVISAPFSYLESRLQCPESSAEEDESRALNLLYRNMNVTIEFFNKWWHKHSRFIPFISYIPPEFLEVHYDELVDDQKPLHDGWPLLVTAGGMKEEYAASHIEKYIKSAEQEQGAKFEDFITHRSFIRRIPLDILKKYIGYISWELYCRSSYVSMDFIEENIERLSTGAWNALTGNLKVPSSFLMKYHKNIDMTCFLRYREPTLEFIKLHDLVIANDVLYKNTNLPLELVIERRGRTMWKCICRSKHVTEEVLRRPDAKLHWKALSSNPRSPMKFIEENLNKVHWDLLSANPSVSVRIIKGNPHRVDWGYLSGNEPFWMRLAKEDLIEELLTLL